MSILVEPYLIRFLSYVRYYWAKGNHAGKSDRANVERVFTVLVALL